MSKTIRIECTFRDLWMARSYISRSTRPLCIVQMEVGTFGIATYANGQRLERQGYEVVR